MARFWSTMLYKFLLFLSFKGWAFGGGLCEIKKIQTKYSRNWTLCKYFPPPCLLFKLQDLVGTCLKHPCPFPYRETQQDSKMEKSGLNDTQIETNLSILQRGFASALRVSTLPFHSLTVGRKSLGTYMHVPGLNTHPLSL